MLRKSPVTSLKVAALQWIALKPILARFLFALDLVCVVGIGSMYTIYVVMCHYLEGRTVKPTPKAVFNHRKGHPIGDPSEARDTTPSRLSKMSDLGDYDSAKSNYDATDATEMNVHQTRSPLKLEKCHGSLSESGEVFPLWKV